MVKRLLMLAAIASIAMGIGLPGLEALVDYPETISVDELSVPRFVPISELVKAPYDHDGEKIWTLGFVSGMGIVDPESNRIVWGLYGKQCEITFYEYLDKTVVVPVPGYVTIVVGFLRVIEGSPYIDATFVLMGSSPFL
jgi:hypothetical protein